MFEQLILVIDGAALGAIAAVVISSFFNLKSIAEAVFYIWDEVKKRLS